MLLSEEHGRQGNSKNDFILMKEGRAWNNTQVLKAIFKLWKPLAKYLRSDRNNEKENKIRTKERRKENIEWVEVELDKKRRRHERNMGKMQTNPRTLHRP